MSNLWQSPEWKIYQESLGREVRIYEKGDAYAQVVIDRTTFGFSVWDIPKGPIGNVECGMWNVESLLSTIIDDAQKTKSLALYFSPEQPINHSAFNIQHSSRTEQPEATRIIDLTTSEEEILAQMKPKGRYNINVAKKHGVTVEESYDIDAFYDLATQTHARDKFRGLPKTTYNTFLNHLPGAFLLLAKHHHEAIAGLLGVVWDTTGIYYYGASNHAHRAKMAPYLLQWHAMAYAKEKGATTYDLFGIAPEDAGSSHPWAGVTSFKEKFGGTVLTYPPEQQVIFKPFIYHLLHLKRKILG